MATLQAPVANNTTDFLLEGSLIQRAIHARLAKHQGEVSACLTKVSTMLQDKSGGSAETLAAEAAAAMLALLAGEHSTASTLFLKALLERSAFLSREQLDLSCIALNIRSEAFYQVSLKEAKRYGLV